MQSKYIQNLKDQKLTHLYNKVFRFMDKKEQQQAQFKFVRKLTTKYEQAGIPVVK